MEKNENSRPVRVRFAPSPTGPLHIGGVRTALYNYLFARHHGGRFLLRIEDTDQTRFVPGAEDYIIESLQWAGITPDEGAGVGGSQGPYRQSERKAIYREYAERLVEEGHAYYAFDTEDELNGMREKARQAGMPNWQYNTVSRGQMKNSLTLPEDEVKQRMASGNPYVIRIKIPRNEEVKLQDIIRGWVVVQTSQMDDKVLFKSDGMPTYHLANVVDDYLMEISHVIRGEEWLPSAPLHVLLYRYLGWEEVMPQFAHLPLLLRPDGNGKLSKRDGDRLGFPVFPLNWKDPASGEESSGYRERGYFPEAFVNFLVLLGWNPGTPQELFSLEELTKVFSLERVSKSGARFDHEKTRWFNQQYLRMKSDQELEALVRKAAPAYLEGISQDYLRQVCSLMKERAVFPADIITEGEYFFRAPSTYEEQAVKKRWKGEAPALVTALADVLEQTEPFDAAAVESAFQEFLKAKGLNTGAVLPLFRITVTGSMTGPGMFDVSALLGKHETVGRMRKAVEVLGQPVKEES